MQTHTVCSTGGIGKKGGWKMWKKILLLAVMLLLVCVPLACGTKKIWVNTLDALEVTADSAQLWGALDDLESGSRAEVKFKVWPADRQDQSEVISAGIMTTVGNFSLRVSNLDPSTTYVFKALATTNGTFDYGGGERTFTTLPAAGAAPTVTTGDVTFDITSGTAVLNGTIESMGGATSLGISFAVKETSADTPAENIYTVGSFNSAGPFNFTIGVTPGSTYSYRAEGASSEGYSGDVYGDDKTFTAPIS